MSEVGQLSAVLQNATNLRYPTKSSMLPAAVLPVHYNRESRYQDPDQVS